MGKGTVSPTYINSYMNSRSSCGMASWGVAATTVPFAPEGTIDGGTNQYFFYTDSYTLLIIVL